MAISKRLRFEILRRDGHRCYYCHDSESKLTIDHVVPTALGGTDDPTNLVAACPTCNGGKTSIAPDSALVAGARQDAMRWQMAWNTAVAEAVRDGAQRASDIAKVKKNYVAAYRGRHGEDPYLPEGWEASVGRWLDLGMPMALIDKAIASAVGRAKVASAARWKYFAGCCWSLLRELADRTQQIADAASETWEQRFTRQVIDTTVLAWRDMWMSSQGCDPEPGQEEIVRKAACSLYPEEIDPGMLIRGAWDAAEAGSTEIGDYVVFAFDPIPEDPEDEFESTLSQAYFTGLASYQHVGAFSLDSDAWMALAIQASAALSAGYTLSAVSIAVYEAGCRGEVRILELLDTPWTQLAKDHPKALILERAEGARLDRAVLDSLIQVARRQAAAEAQHAAECDGTCDRRSWNNGEVPF